MTAKTAMPTLAAKPAASVAKPSLTRLNSTRLQRACGSASGEKTGQCDECAKKSQSLQRSSSGSSVSSSISSETPEQKKKKNEPVLQRLAAGSTPTHHAADADDQKKKDALLQRKADGQSSPGAVPPSVGRTLDSPGRSLDSATRASMEPLFGRDFSSVRVHTDPQAAASARDVDARAYTVGDHVAFASGEYQPHSVEGQALIAHELAHTVQQSGLQKHSADLTIDTAVNSPLEREANAAASAVLRGEATHVTGKRAPLAVSRAAWGVCPAGEVISGHTELSGPDDKKVSEEAESVMAKYIREERSKVGPDRKKGGKALFLASELDNKLEDFRVARGTDDTDKTMVRASQGKVKGVPPFSTAKRGDKDALKAPDVLDFDTEYREVYDVTTERGARDKADKVDKYVRLLQSLKRNVEKVNPSEKEVDKWSAGTSLSPPPKLTFPAKIPFGPGKAKQARPIQICFGPTDFAANPGVIAYEPIKATAADGGDTATLEPYEVDAGTGSKLVFQVPPYPGFRSLKYALDGPNQGMAESLKSKGVVLKMLNRNDLFDKQIKARAKVDTIDAEVDVDKIPLTGFKGGGLVRFTVDPVTRKLILSPHKVAKGEPHSVELKLMSSGHVTSIGYDEATGITGEVEITPSLKLLGKTKLKLEFGPDKLDLKSEIPQDKLNVPIPGFKVTRANLGFKLYPDFVPSGELAFKIGPGSQNWVDGVLKASANAQGFIATGDVTAHVPGMDETTGNFTYQYIPGTGGSWSGEVKLSSSKIPYLKRADAVMHIDDGGILLTGGLVVDLPGGQNELALSIERGQDHAWILGGRARFRVPVHGVEDVNLIFTYDIANRRLKGEGSTGFEVKGLKGHITVHYDNGKIYGKGSLHVDKGRVSGELDPVEMDEHGKFSGKGTLHFKLSDDLMTTVTVEMTKEQEVIITGEIAFIKPIPIFKRISGAKELFSIDTHFPIPGLSIGIIGVSGNIGGSLTAGYYIGDAVIRNLKAFGTIRPLDENPDASVGITGEFYVPAGGKLMGEVHAGVGVGIGVAGVDGNIGINATAELSAEVKAPFNATYKDHKFSGDLGFDANVGLSLTLGLEAYIVAYAGFSIFKVETRWDWPIASIKYAPPSLQARVYLENPLHYDSESGLKIPSLGDFKWDKPKVDASDVFNSVLSSITPSKSEKS